MGRRKKKSINLYSPVIALFLGIILALGFYTLYEISDRAQEYFTTAGLVFVLGLLIAFIIALSTRR